MKNNLLQHINNPKDLRKLPIEDLKQITKELRQFIINIVATKEGHLGASLGVVELTIALHYIFDTPNDLLVWDVGHQAYGHKILTDRKAIFHTNRQLQGIAGFPNRSESKYDSFGVGHSSTSISAALGMAIASNLKGDLEKQHIAVIGDASIAAGMAFEGLNHAGVTNANLLIILNDNTMGIDPSVGALKEYFTNVKAGKSVRKNNIIEALNFNYSGPIDGHDMDALLAELNRLKSIKGPKFLHIITTKGKGLKKAEQNQIKYHAPGKFDANTGVLLSNSDESLPPKYQDVFGLTLVELAEKNEKIVGITPAMPTGSSLKFMLDKFPDRAFDVGIAEQHAVTLSAGLATQGMIPFCNIYSTFLQRSYDQIIHDVALQNLPVVFCIDRAGLVGEDGATHHGVFDISYLRLIPNLSIFAPMNEQELRNIMYTAQLGLESPIAIRYPRGRGTAIDWKSPFTKIEIGKSEQISSGNQIAVLTIGTIGNTIIELEKELPKNSISHYNMRFVKPLDEIALHHIFKEFDTIITIEDGTIVGGFGSAVLEFSSENNYQNKTIKRLGVPDNFVEHGKISELQKIVGLDKDSIRNEILKLI
ncbi:MAG: 1-deoxy-D-xylulose-5-phosphate synthase [Urechidicola sp.]|nr:1-deoxy-D-xylulose-5-phosphate synthase [Urechidicola sp.]